MVRFGSILKNNFAFSNSIKDAYNNPWTKKNWIVNCYLWAESLFHIGWKHYANQFKEILKKKYLRKVSERFVRLLLSVQWKICLESNSSPISQMKRRTIQSQSQKMSVMKRSKPVNVKQGSLVHMHRRSKQSKARW